MNDSIHDPFEQAEVASFDAHARRLLSGAEFVPYAEGDEFGGRFEAWYRSPQGAVHILVDAYIDLDDVEGGVPLEFFTFNDETLNADFAEFSREALLHRPDGTFESIWYSEDEPQSNREGAFDELNGVLSMLKREDAVPDHEPLFERDESQAAELRRLNNSTERDQRVNSNEGFAPDMTEEEKARVRRVRDAFRAFFERVEASEDSGVDSKWEGARTYLRDGELVTEDVAVTLLEPTAHDRDRYGRECGPLVQLNRIWTEDLPGGQRISHEYELMLDHNGVAFKKDATEVFELGDDGKLRKIPSQREQELEDKLSELPRFEDRMLARLEQRINDPLADISRDVVDADYIEAEEILNQLGR